MGRKARVGIVYSNAGGLECTSAGSFYIAQYVAGLLFSTAYADVKMIASDTMVSDQDLAKRRVLYTVPFESKPTEISGSSIEYGYWSLLEDCDVVIMCVDSKETEKCSEKLADTMFLQKRITVINMIKGVRNGSKIRDKISGKECVVFVDSVQNFDVVLDAKFRSYTPTVKYPAIMFERLSKEIADTASGPISLMENMKGVSVYFRKVLTMYAWGVLVFENLYALNTLTKGTLADTLQSRKTRLILALMLRESRNILETAGSKGWKPDFLLINENLSLFAFELILVLPNILFLPIFRALGLMPSPHLVSPGQMDLSEGRKTTCSKAIKELLDISKKVKRVSDVLEMVYCKINDIEEAGKASSIIERYSKYNNNDVETAIHGMIVSQGHSTVLELYFWLSRVLLLTSIIILLLFLFYH